MYGKLEARIKVPAGGGTWPAFWMLGDTHPTVPWPWSGEIDIMEQKGNLPNVLWGTIHGAGGGGAIARMPIQNTYDTGSDLANAYHTYGILWEPDKLTWTYDGNEILSTTKAQWKLVSDADWPCNQPYYLIFNLAMGGDFAGGVSGSLAAAAMKIDWVRYSTYNGYGTAKFK